MRPADHVASTDAELHVPCRYGVCVAQDRECASLRGALHIEITGFLYDLIIALTRHTLRAEGDKAARESSTSACIDAHYHTNSERAACHISG